MWFITILATIVAISIAKDPINPDDFLEQHVDYIQHKFYDLYFYPYNQTLIDHIELSNNPNAIIQQNTSNTDDIPEIRIDLEWDFKFYGHSHNWISISANGFLTTHPVTCSVFCNWWGSQSYRRYIAPIMADFNPGKYDHSHILYYIDNDEKSITVQWHNITLWQSTASEFLGFFWSFQVKLLSDGTIYFYYFNVPTLPSKIPYAHFPFHNYSQHIGLEDAAYEFNGNGLYYLHAYSPIDLNESHVLQRHIVKFQPKSTCIDQLTCSDCAALAADPGSNLECGWCPVLGVCSDGLGREIYEYTSDDYCTSDQMIDHLSSEACAFVEIEERKCNLNDHILAMNPSELTQNGVSRFYSGVILSLNSDSNTYRIAFDDQSLTIANVPYSFVHPCPTVSYDYHSFDLPPICTPHCTQIEGRSSKADGSLLTALGVILAVLVVICGLIQFFVYKGRNRDRRLMTVNNMIMMNQDDPLGMETGDEDEKYNLDTSGEENNAIHDNRLMSADETVNNGIISEYNSSYELNAVNNKFGIELGDDEILYPPKYKDKVDNVVELGQVELESSHLNEEESKQKQKGWNMTPLHDDAQ